MPFRLLMLVLVSATFLTAQEPPPSAEPAKPAVKKLDDTRFQVGDVIFDQKTREIRFPCKVNMTEGLLEYVIVHQKGKIHESLLATEVSPTDINLAFTLLRFRPSRELYALPNETGGLSDKFPDIPPEIKSAARVTIDVAWKDGDRLRRIPVNEWIQHEVKTTSMPVGPFVYGGSDFHEGQFVAETSGDVAAIFISQAALLNYPGQDNADDTVWIPFPKRVPAQDTNVTVIIAPFKSALPLPKP